MRDPINRDIAKLREKSHKRRKHCDVVSDAVDQEQYLAILDIVQRLNDKVISLESANRSQHAGYPGYE